MALFQGLTLGCLRMSCAHPLALGARMLGLPVPSLLRRNKFSRSLLYPQQAPLQEQLHITAPINNQKHIDIILHNAIDDAVGFKVDLVKLP